MRESFTLEYGLKKGSVKSLWNLISTPQGLSEWMADRVEAKNKVYTFYWKDSSEEAEIQQVTPMERIRFRWLYNPPANYFEIRLLISELTGEITLEVTDHAESPDERLDLIGLWDHEIAELIRRVGL